MAKKSSVPDNILFRVLQKSRKNTNKKIKEQQEHKTLLEETNNEEDNDHGSGV